jgi:predicted outer membrane protein
MTLTIDLTLEEEARLQAAARSAGIDVAECARRVLTEHLPPAVPGQATRDLLRAWLEEDATDDPEEIRKAEEELARFKQAMNETRAAAGARLLYP